MKAIVIDDEPKARNLLIKILEDFCPDVLEIDQASNLLEGVEQIKKRKPQIVFLDIEMPGPNGTEILNYFSSEAVDFNIVFTTAHNAFAIKAFAMNAIDYLLKPMRPNKVKEAVLKAKQKNQNNNISRQLQELKATFKSALFQKIGLPVADGIIFEKIENIIFLEADGMYTTFYCANQEHQVVSKPMKYFINLLEPTKHFYRPHRSFYINIKFIKKYIKRDGNYIVMENDKTVPISKDKREEFLALLAHL